MEAVTNYFVDLYNEAIIFRVAVEGIRLAFNNVYDTGVFVFRIIGDLIAAIAENTKSAFKNIGEIIRAVFTGQFELIPGLLAQNFEETKGQLAKFVKDAGQEFETLKSNISGNIQEGIDNALQRTKYEVPGENIDTEAVEEKIKTAVSNGIAAGSQAAPIDPTPFVAQLDVKARGPILSNPLEALETSVDEIEPRLQTKYADFYDRQQEFFDNSGQLISGFATQFVAGFSDVIGAVAAGTAGFGDIGAFLVRSIANIAQQLGKAIVAIGISMQSLQAVFTNPLGAIIAGGALIALSRLLKAAAQNFAGNFSGGGIVPGSSFSGDRLTAGVNSGELILNVAQQKALANTLLNRSAINLIPSIEYDGRNMRVLLNEVDQFNNRVQ
jgi:hypothetical protein